MHYSQVASVLALSMALTAGLQPATQAMPVDSGLFGLQEVSAEGLLLAGEAEANCGAGACGSDKDKGDHKCGSNCDKKDGEKGDDEHKCAADKCGAGACGSDKDKDKDGH